MSSQEAPDNLPDDAASHPGPDFQQQAVITTQVEQ